MGVSLTATDGYDWNIDTLTGTGLTGYAGVHHELDPFDWTGPTGFYHRDYRAMPEPLESKTWESICVWATPTFANDTMYYSMQGYGVLPLDRQYLLELVQVPDGVSGVPQLARNGYSPRTSCSRSRYPRFAQPTAWKDINSRLPSRPFPSRKPCCRWGPCCCWGCVAYSAGGSDADAEIVHRQRVRGRLRYIQRALLLLIDDTGALSSTVAAR